MCFGGQKAPKPPDLGPSVKVQEKQLEFEKEVFGRLYADEAPFREFRTGFLPLLRENLTNVESPGFKKMLGKGLEGLRSAFAASGSPSSGPAQVAGAEFATDLTDRELNRFSENLFRATGAPPGPVQSQAPGVLGPMGATSRDLSDLLATQASFNAQSRGGGGGGFPWGGLFGAGLGLASGLPMFSSRDYKEDINPLDVADYMRILEELESTPVYQWKYRKEFNDPRTHIGPVTEEAPARIVGLTGKVLVSMDYMGFMFAAIKALAARIKELERR